MEQKMKLTKDIIDAVKKLAIIEAANIKSAPLDFTIIFDINNPSEVADAILALLVEYEKQVCKKQREIIADMFILAEDADGDMQLTQQRNSILHAPSPEEKL